MNKCDCCGQAVSRCARCGDAIVGRDVSCNVDGHFCDEYCAENFVERESVSRQCLLVKE